MIDDMGCEAIWPGVITIEEPASPVADAGGDVLICLDEIQDIALQGAATGGTAPYSYSWTGPGITTLNMNDQTPTVSAAGTYTLVVTDANNCTDEAIAIVTTSTLETVVEGPSQRCAGEPAQFQVNPPLPGVTYNWTFTGNPTINSGAVNTASLTLIWPDVPGQYNVGLTVTSNTDGCTKTFSEFINITQEVKAIAGPDQIICQGGFVDLDATSSSSFATYNWTVISGDVTSIDAGVTSNNPRVSPLFDTEYELTAPSPVCCDSDVVLTGSNSLPPVDNPGAALTYLWFANGLPTAGGTFVSADPDPTVNVPANTTYTLIVNDGECADTTEVLVEVRACMSLGSTIFYDDNNNGTQDSNELGLGSKDKSVTVELIDANTGALVADTQTDTNGDYLFTDLLDGDYIVQFMAPASAPVSSTVTNTADDQTDGDDNGSQIDNDGDGLTDGLIQSPVITLSKGDEPVGEQFQGGDQDDADDANGDMTVDFGLVRLVSLGSTVWYDDKNH